MKLNAAFYPQLSLLSYMLELICVASRRCRELLLSRLYFTREGKAQMFSCVAKERGLALNLLTATVKELRAGIIGVLL